MLAISWSPIAVWGYLIHPSNTTEIITLAALYILFLCALPQWGKRIHHWPKPFQYCGLRLTATTMRELGTALVIGVFGVFALFGISTLLGWSAPTPPSPRLVRFIFEGLLMALAVGFAEEMLFRGWILAELETNYTARAALLMNALFFAGTHFIKPLNDIISTSPQFLGLAMLSLALVWARRSRSSSSGETSLGYPIGLHAGLIWGYYIVNVGGLSEPTGQVPTWVTGINENPLAGALGLVLLGAIAAQFAKIAQPKAHAKTDNLN
ncbi:MAG: lysostaphin resistance A-like protein [Phormidesmis sp.]